MNLPTREECFELLKEYHVPENVVAHCEKVAKVAVFLAEKLKEKGADVNIELVEGASLLHDLVRICDIVEFDKSNFKKNGLDITDDEFIEMKKIRKKFIGKHHADSCHDILIEEYPELALVIKRHRFRYILNKDHKPETWEQKLVFYADKRVKHDKIVSLKERFEDGRKRNAHLLSKASNKREQEEKQIFALEKEIFNKIGLEPNSLNALN
ncbi:hypothetical protein CMO89_02625 [Candidatus Woesearchaeota archaeon]|nr:hypothetical protein [Candidatus Woesearchaeota archaeon]|tara:strand:+ start:565 stop:1197 length:633 start_codon:yes stop_codon:yes gene_type:complete